MAGTSHNGHPETTDRDRADLPDECQKHSQESAESYLAREACLARDAISETLESLKTDAVAALDFRDWARENPWKAVGIAGAAGFVAAAVLVPEGKPASGEAASPSNGAPSAATGASHWLSTLLAPALSVVGASAEKFLQGAFQNGPHGQQSPASEEAAASR